MGLESIADQKVMVEAPVAGDYVLGLDVNDPTQSVPKGTMVLIPLALLSANLLAIGAPNATLSDTLTPITWSHAATDGLQAVLGSGTPSSMGTMQGTGNWRAAFNAKQKTAATDSWTQINASEPSALLTIGTDGSGNILSLYFAAAATADANKATFWGSPLISVDHTGHLSAVSFAIGSITGVGTLTSGAIAPGFGAINIGPSEGFTGGSLALADGNSHAVVTVPIVSIANGARHVVMPNGTSTTRITLRLNFSNVVALCAVATTVATNINQGAATLFTHTLSTAGQVNVQTDGTNIVIENLTGATITGTIIIEGTV